MATTTEDPVTLTAEDLDRASERLRARSRQLSFDLGPTRKVPDLGVLKIAGELAVDANLYRGEYVHVLVTNEHGEALAEGRAQVEWPAFKDKTVDEIVLTKRIHTVTLS